MGRGGLAQFGPWLQLAARLMQRFEYRRNYCARKIVNHFLSLSSSRKQQMLKRHFELWNFRAESAKEELAEELCPPGTNQRVAQKNTQQEGRVATSWSLTLS